MPPSTDPPQLLSPRHREQQQFRGEKAMTGEKKLNEAASIVCAVIAYEQGELNDDETTELFQRLIATGLAWKLQGSYGRMAKALIAARVCHAQSCRLETK